LILNSILLIILNKMGNIYLNFDTQYNLREFVKQYGFENFSEAIDSLLSSTPNIKGKEKKDD